MSQLILIAEDDPKVARLARDYLEKAAFRTLTVSDGAAALSAARREKPDLLVLDLNLPAMDGLDVARAVRREAALPIIMLTARAEEADRLIGLELGADDYITKPFSPRELVLRVKAVLRRVQGDDYDPAVLRVADLEIDLNGHRLHRAGEMVEVSRTEFKLLATLARHPGQVFSRAHLLDRLHGYAYDGFDRSIDAHIKNLRRKLEPDPADPRYILTVYGVGYKFAEEG